MDVCLFSLPNFPLFKLIIFLSDSEIYTDDQAGDKVVQLLKNFLSIPRKNIRHKNTS